MIALSLTVLKFFSCSGVEYSRRDFRMLLYSLCIANLLTVNKLENNKIHGLQLELFETII